MTLCEAPAQVAARMDACRAEGVTTLRANFLAPEPEGWGASLRALAGGPA